MHTTKRKYRGVGGQWRSAMRGKKKLEILWEKEISWGACGSIEGSYQTTKRGVKKWENHGRQRETPLEKATAPPP